MSTSIQTRIWVMTDEYPPFLVGGLGTVATKLSHALHRTNARITVFTQTRSSLSRRQSGGISILRIPRTRRYYRYHSFIAAAIESEVRRAALRRPNVIHVHSPTFAPAAFSFKRKYGIPVIYTCHSLIHLEADRRSAKHMITKRLQESLFRSADRIVVPSHWMKTEIRRRFPAAAAKTVVIQHGVESRQTRSRAPRHKLLFVGRLLSQKGIYPLIAALPNLKRTNGHVRLGVIGTGSFRTRRHLVALARRNGVNARIKWYGFLPHRIVQRLYPSFGLLVMPSKQESFGLVAIEAMANGIPLVSTRSGGLKEFVNYRTAQVIHRVDSGSIASSIKAVWRNRSLTDRRVKYATAVARQFTWHRVALRYRKLFARLRR